MSLLKSWLSLLQNAERMHRALMLSGQSWAIGIHGQGPLQVIKLGKSPGPRLTALILVSFKINTKTEKVFLPNTFILNKEVQGFWAFAFSLKYL